MMVASIRHCARILKFFLLAAALAVIWGAVWLQSGVHQLDFLRGRLLAHINRADAPYTVAIGDVSIDWRSITRFGRLTLQDITVTTRAGETLLSLPQVIATINPLGFLPDEVPLGRVTLSELSLNLLRDADGQLRLGFAGGQGSLPLKAILATASRNEDSASPLSLPLRHLIVERAALTFSDAQSGISITSEAGHVDIRNRRHGLRGELRLPLQVNGAPGGMAARLDPAAGGAHMLSIALANAPAGMVCAAGACPPDVTLDGALNLSARFTFGKDAELSAANIRALSSAMTLTAPAWFVAPVPMHAFDLSAGYDPAAGRIALNKFSAGLEDTDIAAQGVIEREGDSWHAKLEGGCGKLDIRKLYKYWPLFMAPTTRQWVTSKLKYGYAAKAWGRLDLTPQDIASPVMRDEALSVDISARDMTVDYLPGFFVLTGVNGEVHFTGTTVKISADGGHMLSDTHLAHATLVCPNLNHPNNPMEVTLDLDAAAADVARIFSHPLLTFDDHWALNPETLGGRAQAQMTLKFNSFSGKPGGNPDEIHLESVDYDIAAQLQKISQPDLAGGYRLRDLSGKLEATNAATKFTGTIAVGDSGPTAITLHSTGDRGLTLTAKSQGNRDGAHNDFTLNYVSADPPRVTLSGDSLDASVQYAGGKSSGNFSQFPAIDLTLSLARLYLNPRTPLEQVKAHVLCDSTRCREASLDVGEGKSAVKGAIEQAQGGRHLILRSPNAGDFLDRIDITDHLKGGALELKGTYDDTLSPPAMSGRLLITDFKLVKSPILGRILAIGSLTGLSNTLTGSGIAFDKLGVSVVSRNGVLTLSEGRASGNAMGITFTGEINAPRNTVNIKGVIVPAYVLNSFVANIPIIGMLAGGEGEGLIAFNYSVRGSLDAPEVSVNPLSGLTPGFLRGIFGVFDSDQGQDSSAGKPEKQP